MASRKPSVRHPSHSHPLSGHKALAEEEIICSGCDLDLIGAAFKCTKSECDYFLHKSCFSLPRETLHNSHPAHPLTLFYSSPYAESSTYECSACAEIGTGFAYNCSICQFDLHVGCISLPVYVKREGHEHPLTLRYCSPYRNCKVFQCHICQNIVPDHLWSYYCNECDYGTHLHYCEVEEKVEPKRGGGRGGEKASTSGNNGVGGRGSVASEVAAMLEAQREIERMQIEVDTQIMIAKMAKKARKACLKNI